MRSQVATSVRFTAAPGLDRRSGLLGRVSLDLGPIALEGVPLLQTATGEVRLAYPELHRGATGVAVRVLDDAWWEGVAQGVVAELGRQGVLEGLL